MNNVYKDNIEDNDDEPPMLIPSDDTAILIEENQDTSKKVPVTIITGFLGAGKTTFLNYILTERHGKRIAVIQNERGIETGAEAATVVGKDGKASLEYFELPNGCVCCSVRGDLVLTLENLMQRKSKFDYILIETSGLADPGPLASTFWVDDELDSDLYLDGIVTIVDAKYFKQHLEELKPEGVINEAQRQVAFADRIVINKIDLVSASELQALKEKIRSHNYVAEVFTAHRSVVDLSVVLDIKAFELEQALKVDPLLLDSASDSCCDSHHDKHHCHSSHRHDDSVQTVAIVSEGSIPLEEFRQWIGQLLWSSEESEEGADSIFRTKGLLSIKDNDTKYALQSVHSLFDIQPTKVTWQTEEPRINKLVFIGRHLDQSKLEASFLKMII